MTARYDLAKIKLGKLMTDPDAEGIILDVIPDLKASPTYLVARTLTASAALKLAEAQIGAEKASELRRRVEALEA
ncbi:MULTISPECIES: hypothetical protein [Microbacterium]|jgi:hypothetical protein|uniref:Uncharacterized protein n=3 Tax=Microbacterium TaxID=33882 RepID=A0A1H0QNK9_MICTS|nr:MULTISPECIES: hypothetical protein [Microbacterium]MCY1716097.1 hypothetical protein [Microbacterium sp. SL62]MDZ5146221.1 hypothetical protein [Microbacterium testaceum]WAC70521.1 hypothetical protein OVA17_07430 [Microbacterium sp. SL75]WJS91267.1 hypothetical protein NYQ11_01545 [Microbacterium testaceum]SDP18675.1 hypothetical protein SAMN04487788_2437 [Microbacterium testaceum StLB037]